MNGSMTEFDMKPCRWEKVMAAVIVALVLCALVCASVIVIGGCDEQRPEEYSSSGLFAFTKYLC